jgi:rfaE bifunctional protein kinase chain/domain
MDKDKALKTIQSFQDKTVLIVGDVMIDAYIMGNVDRISPEAPVPVVSVSERYSRLGGAANVALNVKSLGATPLLCSIIGDDSKGDEFMELLDKRNMATNGLIRSRKRPTTTKFRVIGNNTQMLRVDEESTHMLDSEEFMALSVSIIDMLDQHKVDAIIIEDYDKGCIEKGLLEMLISEARTRKIPVSADPKKQNFNQYKKLNLFKPNYKELIEGLNIDIDIRNYEQIANIAKDLLDKKKHKMILVTLSNHGMLICSKDEWHHIPAEIRQISDVSGAGDTVISTISLALAAGMPMKDAAQLANIAGGLVCEYVGVVPIHINDLIEELQ